jgi:hypothetical protein
VANEGYVGNVLQAHHAHHAPAASHTGERHAGAHFSDKRFERHVWFMPAVGRNHAAVRERRVVDDGGYGVRVLNRLDYLLPRGSGSPFAL